MKQEVNLIRARLKTPRAAAVAGVLFSVLLITGLLLLRLSVPADPLEAGAWLKDQCQHSRSGAEPGALRRHSLFMVHRRAA